MHAVHPPLQRVHRGIEWGEITGIAGQEEPTLTHDSMLEGSVLLTDRKLSAARWRLERSSRERRTRMALLTVSPKTTVRMINPTDAVSAMRQRRPARRAGGPGIAPVMLRGESGPSVVVGSATGERRPSQLSSYETGTDCCG